MSTTNGNMKSFKVTDKNGNVFVLTPVDTTARQAIDEAKNLQFDEDYFTADVSQDQSTVNVGLNGVPLGVDTDTPLKFVQDTAQGIVLGSDAPFATAIAPVYNPQSTYAEGVRCMYKGKLYRCSTAIQAAEAWTAAHWTEEPVSEMVSNVTPLVIRISNPDNAWHIDRTFAEIKSAYDTGAPVIVLFEGGSADNIFVGQIDRVHEISGGHEQIDFQQVSYPTDLSGHRTIIIMKAFLTDDESLTVNVFEHVIDSVRQSVIAPEYSRTTSYLADSFCTYEGINYKCTTPTSGSPANPEDFDISKWTTADTIMNMIGDVESQFTAVEEALSDVNDILEDLSVNPGMTDLGNKTEADLDNGALTIATGNSTTKLTLTTVNALTLISNIGVPNFAITIDNSGNSNDVTVSVVESDGTTALLQSSIGGNTITAGKIVQLSSVGNCFAMAEFESNV